MPVHIWFLKSHSASLGKLPAENKKTKINSLTHCLPSVGVPTQSICIYFIIHSLVGLFQAKLELLTGGSVGSMKVTVLDKENQLVCNLDNNDALLGSYPIDSGMIIHVCEMNINCVCIHLSVCLSACICLYIWWLVFVRPFSSPWWGYFNWLLWENYHNEILLFDYNCHQVLPIHEYMFQWFWPNSLVRLKIGYHVKN